MGLQYKKDVDKLEQVLPKATKVLRELDHWTCEERLRKLGLFSLRRLWGNIITDFHFLREGYQEHRARLFIKVYGRKTRDNKSKLPQHIKKSLV